MRLIRKTARCRDISEFALRRSKQFLCAPDAAFKHVRVGADAYRLLKASCKMIGAHRCDTS
jgi:hypothetical protein